MISDEMRKRIAALNRRDLKHKDEVEVGDSEPEPEAKPVRREWRAAANEDVVRAPDPSELRVIATAADARLRLSLDEVAQGVEVDTLAGQFLLIDQTVQDLLHGAGEGFSDRYKQAIEGVVRQNVPVDRYGTFDPLVNAVPEDVIYVDIEATGLTAGTPLFLIGALVYVDGNLRVQQFLARDYTEEAALLTHFSEVFDRTDVVVSFNGKSYDLPYIRDRCLFMGVPFRPQQAHIDMLHVGRRLWRKRLPNCKLQTLEQYICKRTRRGDIPGAEIPDAYHVFVRTGNAVQMRDILHHNALDLLTTAEILMFVLEGREL
ncbi:MAG: ribonuclease H-like domain-containing protein [Candidatus Latescibacteria bacterium]|nr:ribonuclease H-like domain-containing protein [Candidatus Latescibacterota bacterium]